MKRFNYRAKDNYGRLVTGEVEASNMASAARLVRERGLVVISVKVAVDNPITWLRRLRDRITSSDITNFTRQLATMVNAGLPLTEGLLILRQQSKGSMQKMVAQILADIESGESLSSAISRHSNVFSPSYIALIKSGEVGGVMDQVLVRLADNLEKTEEFKGKVKGALIYPVIIVVGMIVVAFIMMVFVIPRLTSLYSDLNADLPLPTKILISISSFMLRFWPIIVGLVALGFYGLTLYRRTAVGKRRLDELTFKIPIFGELQKEIMLTEITRTLSLMIGAGVSILEGLNITASVIGNSVLSDALKDSAKQVEKGFPIAFSFAKHPDAFPYLVSQMVAVGEETGKMEEVLTKVSHIYEVQSNEKVKALTSAIEPIVMIILGIGVAFLVIAIILPIYNLTTKL